MFQVELHCISLTREYLKIFVNNLRVAHMNKIFQCKNASRVVGSGIKKPIYRQAMIFRSRGSLYERRVAVTTRGTTCTRRWEITQTGIVRRVSSSLQNFHSVRCPSVMTPFVNCREHTIHFFFVPSPSFSVLPSSAAVSVQIRGYQQRLNLTLQFYSSREK